MKGYIPIEEAVEWLTRMAAGDGVITPNERRILKEFGERYGIEPYRLYRTAHGKAGEVAEPEVVYSTPEKRKGRLFEEFIVSLISDRTRYKLLSWRGDKISDGTFPIDTLLPDLHIRHSLTRCKVDYLMECKYRSRMPVEGVDISEQFARYYREAKRRHMELFIALGVGGTPSAPEQLYIVPGRMMKSDTHIDSRRFVKCLCGTSKEAFHAYIDHYYERRVFSKRYPPNPSTTGFVLSPDRH